MDDCQYAQSCTPPPPPPPPTGSIGTALSIGPVGTNLPYTGLELVSWLALGIALIVAALLIRVSSR